MSNPIQGSVPVNPSFETALENDFYTADCILGEWVLSGSPSLLEAGYRMTAAGRILQFISCPENTSLVLCDLELTSLPEVFDLKCFSTRLKSLDASHNNLTALPEALYTLRNLNKLDLSYNRLKTFVTPTDFCKWPLLTTLNLMSNGLRVFPDFIGEMPQLAAVNLSYNALSALPPRTNWTRLKKLDLRANSFTDAPEAIFQLPKKCEVVISSCPFTRGSVMRIRLVMQKSDYMGPCNIVYPNSDESLSLTSTIFVQRLGEEARHSFNFKEALVYGLGDTNYRLISNLLTKRDIHIYDYFVGRYQEKSLFSITPILICIPKREEYEDTNAHVRLICKAGVTNIVAHNIANKIKGLPLIPIIFCLRYTGPLKTFDFDVKTMVERMAPDKKVITGSEVRRLFKLHQFCQQLENPQIQKIVEESLLFVHVKEDLNETIVLQEIPAPWESQEWSTLWQKRLQQEPIPKSPKPPERQFRVALQTFIQTIETTTK